MDDKIATLIAAAALFVPGCARNQDGATPPGSQEAQAEAMAYEDAHDHEHGPIAGGGARPGSNVPMTDRDEEPASSVTYDRNAPGVPSLAPRRSAGTTGSKTLDSPEAGDPSAPPLSHDERNFP